MGMDIAAEEGQVPDQIDVLLWGVDSAKIASKRGWDLYRGQFLDFLERHAYFSPWVLEIVRAGATAAGVGFDSSIVCVPATSASIPSAGLPVSGTASGLTGP